MGACVHMCGVSVVVSVHFYSIVLRVIFACVVFFGLFFFFSSRRRHTRFKCDWSSDVCSSDLAWGYVDHAPLAPFLARLSGALLGDSLPALRFLPALAAAAKVLLGGWMARELGGGKYAQFLAAFCVLLAPIYLTFDNFFSMNAFEPVFWMACAA